MSIATGANQLFVLVFEEPGEFNQPPNGSLSEYGQEPALQQTTGDPVSDITRLPEFFVLGTDETMDTQDRSQNVERMARPFDRSGEEVLEGSFDLSISSDFRYTNPQFFRLMFGDPTPLDDANQPANGIGYTFELDPRIPPRTFQLVEETHYSVNGSEEIVQTVYTGCAISSVDVDVSTGDPVDVSLDGDAATEITRSTADGDSLLYGSPTEGLATSSTVTIDTEEVPLGASPSGEQPQTFFRPLHFGNSELQMDLNQDGTQELVRKVQSASFSLAGNTEMQEEIGTRFKVAPSFLQFEPEVSYTRLVERDNPDKLKRSEAYGYDTKAGSFFDTPQESLTSAQLGAKLVLENRLSENTHRVTMNLLSSLPDSLSRSGVGDPSAQLEEDVDRIAVDGTVEVVVPEPPDYDGTGSSFVDMVRASSAALTADFRVEGGSLQQYNRK